MSIETEKSDYMLLFRGTDWDKELSAEEIQGVLTQWYTWFDGLIREKKALSGHPLKKEGRIVTGKKGRIVADGPYVESKEAIGGYFYLQVSGMDEALEIAKQCPALEYGLTVEVRPVAGMCPIKGRAMELNGELAMA